MAQAQAGDRVRVHYRGTLADGEVFSTTYEENEPFEFTLGQANVLPRFGQAILGMVEGEKKTVVIPPAEAYGEHRSEFVFSMERSRIPDGMEVTIGKRLRVGLQQGATALATVTAITDDAIELDANDPLAGKTLTFEIELLEIIDRAAPPQ